MLFGCSELLRTYERTSVSDLSKLFIFYKYSNKSILFYNLFGHLYWTIKISWNFIVINAPNVIAKFIKKIILFSKAVNNFWNNMMLVRFICIFKSINKKVKISRMILKLSKRLHKSIQLSRFFMIDFTFQFADITLKRPYFL